MHKKCNPSNLLFKGYHYDKWCKKLDEERSKSQLEETIAERLKLRRQKSDNKYSSDTPLLESTGELIQEIGLKNLTSDKLLTRLPILLAQIKAGNNSYKLKNEITQILCLLNQHNKITKKVYNNLINS